MTAKQFLKEHRIYEDEVIYNTVDEAVGRLSDLMEAYYKEKLLSLSTITPYEIKNYLDGWWITFFSSGQGKRIQLRGPYVKKTYAELDLEKLNNKNK
jgi:hypothetical protein